MTITIESWNSKRFGGVGCPKLGKRTRRIQAIVLHSTEGHERVGSARNSCSWFDNPAAKGNAHYVVDSVDTIQFAADDRNAWHANAASQWTIGIEHSGRASQTDEQWLDEYSAKVLTNSAKLAAYLCTLHGIEVRRLTPDEIRAIHAGTSSVTGFLYHSDVTHVLRSGTHVDPGWSDNVCREYLLAVRGYIELAAL